MWDCVDGVLPLRRRSSDLAEERRLFYVAASRARQTLVLALPEDDEPSPFLREVGLTIQRSEL